MNQAALLGIAATGFSVAFFHAAIPTHWLPFVLASRAQGWTRARTLWVTALAGGGHVFFTTVLGALVAGLGMAVDKWTGEVFPLIAGGLLIAFGLYYLVQHARGKGHHHAFGGHAGHDHAGHDHAGHDHARHDHAPHDHAAHDHGHPAHDHAAAAHDHADDHAHAAHAHAAAAPAVHADDHAHAAHAHAAHPHSRAAPAPSPSPSHSPGLRSDRAVITGLLLMLTFSPCEGFLPVYVSGIAYGWAGFALLSAVLAGATLAGMLTFTWLTLAGLARFRLGMLERYEGALLGGLLCALGVLVLVLEG